ncbi:MAG: hypothetical protein DWI58_19095 [Chloroflexi bacterium]|nr:MAG: hypothetical protein DWI58_19095 [Chloroflexota bacterium]
MGTLVLDIVQFDHISMAVPALQPQIEFLTKVLGFRFLEQYESDEGYFAANFDVPGRSALGWEVLMPNSPESYVNRFLSGSSGPGLHHVAFQVRTAHEAVEAIRAEGIEPWGYRERPEVESGGGVIYLHPRSGGHGFLFQIYSGDPWHESQAFEDDGEHTLGITAVNHLSHAHPSRAELGDYYERLFGMKTIYTSPEGDAAAGFNTRVLETNTGQLRFEILEPTGPDSFVQKFLDARGPSMHHVTFEVGDWERAVSACAHHNIPLFGERTGETDGAVWKEAFIHPKHTGGMLVQFFWEAKPGIWI